MPFTEQDYENSIIELFEKLDYLHIYGPEYDHDFSSPLIILSTVDFPQPLGPSRQVIVPFSHSREKSTVTVSQVL